MLMQLLRMRLGVPTLTPAVATKCNCLPNGNYGGGRRFDRARDCSKDEDFACGVRIADEPLHGILCRRRQQRIVARHDAVAKVLTTRLRSLPGVTVVEEPPAPTEALPGARADLKVEVKARKWLIAPPPSQWPGRSSQIIIQRKRRRRPNARPGVDYVELALDLCQHVALTRDHAMVRRAARLRALASLAASAKAGAPPAAPSCAGSAALLASLPISVYDN